MTRTSVLDASALLALWGNEPGAAVVAPLLEGGLMSAVNWAEVVQRYAAEGLPLTGRQAQVEALGVSVVPFTAEHADVVATLLPATRAAGLSLGDRACLALAIEVGGQAVSADRAWGELQVDVPVRLIR